MQRGNQHGGQKCDDLQTWLDMTLHENPLWVSKRFICNINTNTKKKPAPIVLDFFKVIVILVP